MCVRVCVWYLSTGTGGVAVIWLKGPLLIYCGVYFFLHTHSHKVSYIVYRFHISNHKMTTVQYLSWIVLVKYIQVLIKIKIFTCKSPKPCSLDCAFNSCCNSNNKCQLQTQKPMHHKIRLGFNCMSLKHYALSESRLSLYVFPPRKSC